MVREAVVSNPPQTREVRVKAGVLVTPPTHQINVVTPIIVTGTKVGIVCHHSLVLGRTSCLHDLERKITTQTTLQILRRNEALTSPAKASP